MFAGGCKRLCLSRCERADLLDAAPRWTLQSPSAVPEIELLEQCDELVVVDIGPRQRIGFKHKALARQRQEVEWLRGLIGLLGVAVTRVA